MAYILHFKPEAVEDIAKLKKAGNKAAIKKLEQLLLELMEHPTTGTGQVEPLKGNLSVILDLSYIKKEMVLPVAGSQRS